jgi:hypothetical protein
MTTLTLTPEPLTASVDVLVSGIPAATTSITILRTGIDGSRVPLRGSPFRVAGGTVVAVDGEVPFGVDVRYTVAEEPTVTGLVRLDIDVPWLTHPLAPFLSVPCTIEDDDEWTLPGRTYVFDVIGRAEPVYTWYRRSTRNGVLTLDYANVGERAAIIEVLATGAPLLIRYPAGYPQFPSAYLGAGEARVIPRGVGSHEGSIEVSYVVVAAPPSSVSSPASANWTWDDVPSQAASWAALVAAFPSWVDVVLFNPPAPSPAPPWDPGLPAPPPPFGT